MSGSGEFALLSECVRNQSEATDGTVRFIYVDDETIYRFENNKMKKVSKSLINKAKKENEVLSYAKDEKVKKPKKVKARKVLELTEEEDAEDGDVEQDEQVEQVKQAKPKPKPKPKAEKPEPFHPVDLDEFYSNKHKMEYMNMEIERLSNKVNKLKQYKQIVNKLSGNEWDASNNIQQSQSIQQTAQPGRRNDSLFMF